MSRSSFVPVAELEGFADDRFAWAVQFPEYVPTEHIGVNVDLIHRLAHLGGLGHISIGTYDGEQTTYSAEVSSIGSDGSATAGFKALTQKAALSKAELDDDQTSLAAALLSEYHWPGASVLINNTELDSRMAEVARSSSLRDPQPWSRVLNGAISRGIAQAGTDNLTANVSPISRYFLGINIIANTYFNVPSQGLNSLGFAAGFAFFTQAISTLLGQKLGADVGQRRLSMIPGYQFDRLAILKGMSRTLKTVKAI